MNLAVINHSKPTTNMRIQIPIGVHYRSDPALVRQTLEAVARASKQVLEMPAPEARFEGFGESTRPWPAHVLFPQWTTAQEVAALGELLKAERALVDWVAETLPEPLSDDAVHVEEGEFLDEVATASDFDAAVVVLPEAEGSRPGLVTQLVRKAGVPVLVTRPGGAGKTVIAATDMAHEGYPVVRRAPVLVEALKLGLVVFHNVPLLDFTPIDSPMARSGGREARYDELVEYCRAQLATSLDRIDTVATTVVGNRRSASAAILEVARAHEADLVVVGSPLKPGLLHHSVAEDVLGSARILNGLQRHRPARVAPHHEPDAARDGAADGSSATGRVVDVSARIAGRRHFTVTTVPSNAIRVSLTLTSSFSS